jgi:hypothetical protein
VESEQPLGESFGEAALAMAKEFSFRPKTVDGVPVDDGEVHIPLHFSGARLAGRDLHEALQCAALTQARMQVTPRHAEAAGEASREFLAWRFNYLSAAITKGLRPSEIARDLETEAAKTLPLYSASPEAYHKTLDFCRNELETRGEPEKHGVRQ